MIAALLVSNVLLWLLSIVLACVVLALVRQIGVLHERLSPAGALMLNNGLKVGHSAPAQQLLDLNGRQWSVGGEQPAGKSTLLMFVSPSCPVCKALLPVLLASRRSEEDWLQIVLASDGGEQEHRRFIERQGIQDLPYVLSASLGIAYQASRLPFAALIDEHGILRARGLVNSREHIESLFEAKKRGVASLQEYLESQAG